MSDKTRYFFRDENTKDEWLTPPELVNSLGVFDLDPASPINRPWPTAIKHYTVKDDGLSQIWEGRVWMNPPYGNQIKKWMDKLSIHGDGIALVFARTETRWFHKYCWQRATGIFFFEGRIAFSHINGVRGMPAMASSCLVIYGENNRDAVLDAINCGGIKGIYVEAYKRDSQ